MTRFLLVSAVLALAAVAGCRSSGHPAATPTTTTSPTTTSRARPGTTTTAGTPGALQAEANATAAGDIPDNQVFLVFRNSRARYSIKYPEGWAQQGTGDNVSFRDKNNVVRIVVGPGATLTKASVQSDIAHLHGAQVQSPAHATTISGKPGFQVTYSTVSAPNAVTGKRVKLVVDRYYLWKSGRRAVVDLGTPEGVDNVDAYRLMIESFRWS
jgi:hypothetical protein